MKLIFCPDCQDVYKPYRDVRKTCQCGYSWGMYDDNGLDLYIGGKAVPIGFDNLSFVMGLKSRPKRGRGTRFVAFIIPENVPTIHFVEEGVELPKSEKK